MIQGLYGKNSIMEKALDVAQARNDTISQNIANVDTPDYKRKDVAFEQYFADSLNKGNINEEVDKFQPAVIEDNSDSSMRIDGNNVDIDSEMSYLAKNTIRYNALVQLINGNFSKIKNVIREGK
ncbi:flagellar basal body rod protein FlgB [Ruminiclostridium sufflavum]|uniref:flagellar basal body rod protein FlgB n=1 Tax=Ruminiclostridium sufflavum TaxID=396504 RepID=UPI000D7C148E|nr:flagellar basal body rod protein FlgB [Ruminiclostridium sufflavum]